MDENLLANIDQELLIKNLDDLNSNQSVSFPIQDLSSYGDEVANHLEQIAVGAIKQYATGAAKNQKFSTVLKDSTLSHFGIQVKPQKGAAKNAKNLKNVKSVPTAQFIAIAAIMAVISANLKEIIAREKQIIDFLEVDKQSKIKSDVLVLNKVIREYSHNYDNDKFLSSRENQVIEIKREAEHNILFYKEIVERDLNAANKGIYAEVDKVIAKIQNQFQYYKLCLYIFAYSSFLDVILLGNFYPDFIDMIRDEILEQVEQYRVTYENAYQTIEKIVKKSGKSQGLKIASAATKLVGNVLTKTKATKQGEKMKDNSASLDKKRDDSIETFMIAFSQNQTSGVEGILNNLELIKKIHSDEANIYLTDKQIIIENN